MEKITSVAELKNAIQLLEEEQVVKQQMLKEQFYLTYDSFKPTKILSNTLKEMIASPHMVENIIDTSVSLATGFLAKRVIAGASDNILRRIMGSVIQFAVTNLLSRNADEIKSFGKLAFQHIFSKKAKSEKI